MVMLLYIVALLGSVVGGLVLVFGVPAAKGSPGEAAAAAIAVALAVIPYVFARCVQITTDRTRREAQLDRIAKLLEGSGRPEEPAEVQLPPAGPVRINVSELTARASNRLGS